MSIEREDHIHTSIGVPRLQQAYPIGDRCIQGRTGSSAVTKQDDGHYHHVAFGSRMLTSSEQNYHSSKLESWH